MKIKRISHLSISPNKINVAYEVYSFNEHKNTVFNSIHVTNLLSNSSKHITSNHSDSNPIWFDDQTIGFLRAGALWAAEIDGEHYKVSDFPIPISQVSLNLRSRRLGFTANVYQDGSMHEAFQIDKKRLSQPYSGVIYGICLL